MQQAGAGGGGGDGGGGGGGMGQVYKTTCLLSAAFRKRLSVLPLPHPNG